MRTLRWTLYSALGLVLTGIAVFFVLRMLGITIRTGPRKVFASDNILWLSPSLENSRYSDGDGFRYKGDSVPAFERDGFLRVNGNSYGKVQIGDPVDISTRGGVLVNGQPREAR